MLFRVIALFLLIFSVPAFAGTERLSSTSSSIDLTIDARAGHTDASGDAAPCDEHPLDELPGQSTFEGATDSPALMMACPDAKAPLVTMARPRPYALVAWCAPYLDGPQRPPCAALVNA